MHIRFRCVVPGCEDKTSFRHCFPKRGWGDDIFQTWLIRINNPKLKYKSRRDIARRSYVCSRHFDESCKVPGSNKLKCPSLPTLHLPNFPEDPSLKLKDIWPEGCHDRIDLAPPPETESDRQMVDESEVLLNLDSFPTDIIHTIQSHRLYNTEIKIRDEGTDSKSNDNFPTQVEEFPSETPSTSSPEDKLIKEDDNVNVCVSETIVDLTNDVDPKLEKNVNFDSLESLLFSNDQVAAVCRICLLPMNMEEYEQSQQTPQQMTNIVKLVLPDLDLNMYPNNKFCGRCMELLVYSYELKETWLAAEEKLQKILKKKAETTHQNRQLTDVHQENFQPETVAPDTGPTKTTTKRRYRCKESIYGLGPYQCEQCGRIYETRKQFHHHRFLHKRNIIKIQIDKQKHKCDICGREFRSVGYLSTHIQKHIENPEPENYECTKCKKVFNKKAALSNHIKCMHLRQREYVQCHLCGVKLSSRCSLRHHMMRHSDKKVHPCLECHKKFFFQASLRKHARVHSKEKSFTCQYCGKAIKYEMSLKNHIRVFHMDGGKHVCEICKRPYTNRYNLVHHKIRVHGCTFPNQEVNQED